MNNGEGKGVITFEIKQSANLEKSRKELFNYANSLTRFLRNEQSDLNFAIPNPYKYPKKDGKYYKK